MRLKEFFEFINKTEYTGDIIVRLKYKYDWEGEYTYENVILFSNFGDSDCDLYERYRDGEWNTDWCEGQQDVFVVGFVAVKNIEKDLIRFMEVL